MLHWLESRSTIVVTLQIIDIPRLRHLDPFRNLLP